MTGKSSAKGYTPTPPRVGEFMKFEGGFYRVTRVEHEMTDSGVEVTIHLEAE